METYQRYVYGGIEDHRGAGEWAEDEWAEEMWEVKLTRPDVEPTFQFLGGQLEGTTFSVEMQNSVMPNE